MKHIIPLPAFMIIVFCCPAAARSEDRPPDPAPTPEWVTPEVRAPRVTRVIFESKAAKSKVSFFIYTPAQYDSEKDRRFPVLYWLHGSGGGLSGVPELASRFDEAVREGKAPAMLVVFPNGLKEGMWCDSKDGRTPVETILVKELLPFVDASFRTIASRDGRMLEGFSMGGYGAARLGFKHHDLFGAVSILGGGPLQKEFKPDETPRADPEGARRLMKAVYGDDQEYFRKQSPWELAGSNADSIRGRTLVRQIIGDRDETLQNNRLFHMRLTRLQIPHAFEVLPGVDHNPKAVMDAMGDSFFYFHRAAFFGTNHGEKGKDDDSSDDSSSGRK